jgi:hypothetical protein
MTTDNDSPRVSYAPPWKDAPDGPAANVALADLVNNLPRRLTVDGVLHAETLLAATGAIAGYAAQRALMGGMTVEAVVDPSSGFEIVQTTNGGYFFFGEPLDRTLLPQSPADPHKLWTLAASGAMTAGLAGNALPPIAPMFEYVAKTLGSEREGSTSVPGCHFRAPARELLMAVWPLALTCFAGQVSGEALSPPVVVSQRWRPVIAAHVANRMIRHTALAVPPLKALTIVMETAIYASKLQPAMVEGPAPVSA